MSLIKTLIMVIVTITGGLISLKCNLQPLSAFTVGGLTMWVLFLVDTYLWRDK